MAARLEGLGYSDYRPSDAALMRLLVRGPMAVGRIGDVLGVTRQAARKAVDGLASAAMPAPSATEDSRKLNVVLTAHGQAYAGAVTDVIGALNSELGAVVDPVMLSAAEVVLRSVIASDTGIASRSDVGLKS